MTSRSADTVAKTTPDLSRREFLGIAAAVPGAVKASPSKGKAVQQLRQPPASGSEFDIIIIGGGTMGLAAAYYAAQQRDETTGRPYKTLLLEQFTFGNTRASSGGDSRIFRVMHSHRYKSEQGAAMVRLAEIARALWHEIESAGGGRPILKPEPLLFYGSPQSPPGPEGDLGKIRDTLRKLGVPFTWLEDAEDLKTSFPAFKAIPDGYFGIVQRNSAVIRAHESIRLFKDLASRAGAVLLEEQTASVTRTSPPYQVSCHAGTYHAPRLILCPGAWTNEILEPFGLKCDLTIWEMTVAYFKADTRRYRYPLWYEFGPDGESFFYGFPSDEVRGHIKASVDFPNATYEGKIPKDHAGQPDQKLLRRVRDFLRERFKGAGTTWTRASTCLYTMTPDQQMVLGLLPDSNDVAIFTGDSGRGFKFTPLFGRILVDLVTTPTGKTYYNIDLFSPTREGPKGQPIIRSNPAA